jgi:hypothetical protein
MSRYHYDEEELAIAKQAALSQHVSPAKLNLWLIDAGAANVRRFGRECPWVRALVGRPTFIGNAGLNKCPLAFRFRYLEGIQRPISLRSFAEKQVYGALKLFFYLRQQDACLNVPDFSQHVEKAWGQAVVNESIVFDSPAEEVLLRAIAIIESAWVEIIEGVVWACRSSTTVASSLPVVRHWCRFVVPDPGDGVADHLAEVDRTVVHR